MKKSISANLPCSRVIGFTAVFFLSILLSLVPFTALAQQEIDDGVAWLLVNQNPSGSWGDPELTEFRDTTVVADALKKLRETGTGYTSAINFINIVSPPNNDYLARKTSVLVQEGIDVSLLVDELLSTQNPGEWDNTLLNYPEGGWGAAADYSTNCLDTSLAMNALIYSPVPKGLLVVNKSIASGETQEFTFDYPADALDMEILISEISGSITFRLFPDDSAGSYSWGPLTSTTYLNTTGITISPGTRRVQIYGDSASTYSFKISLTSGGYDSSVLVNPLAYLLEAQNADGGWGLSKESDSNVYLTSRILITLEAYAEYFDLETPIANGIAWLKSRQNPDNGFGPDGSTVYETALAYIALGNDDLTSSEAQNALAFLLAGQEANGSWNNNPYDTGVSLLAIYTSMLETDTDGDGVPDLIDNCPDDYNPDQKNTDKENEGLPGYPAGDERGDVCDNDDDNDGLTDDFEINYTGTDPLSPDSDGDGIFDGFEDMDFDGITNADEFAQGTDPKAPDLSLSAGLNLFGHPVAVPGGYTSYDLLIDLGMDDEVDKIQRYNPDTGTFETTTYEEGAASGSEFNIVNEEGYLIYMKVAKSITFAGQIISSAIFLEPGLNIVSISCMPADYTSYDLLWLLGSSDVAASIQRFNRETGAFETTAYYNEQPSGVEFYIANSEAYIVQMKSAMTIPALLSAPVVAITSLEDGTTVSSSPMDVSGTISGSTSMVTVNGIRADISEGTFTATGIPLTAGLNTITAIAASQNNLTGSDTISVILDEGVDYEINIGGLINDSRIFQGDSVLLDQAAYYTQTQIGVPSFITYTTTGLSRVSATDMQVSFSIQVSGTASEGIYEFQVEYGLQDSGNNPLEPLTNNIFSFKIKIVP
ncbi:MAG: hypothetical protein JRE64_04150 [Deltaproteobacteria bacterium]|nr:hypothetical protein [Deltaproteobacteria bacterium]